MRLHFERGLIDLARREALEPDGTASPLSDLETKFLTYMALRLGQAVERTALLSEVWNYNPNVESRAVDLLVSKVRKKIVARGGDIRSVRGLGYRLEGVTSVETGPRTDNVPAIGRLPPILGREGELASTLPLLQPSTCHVVVGEPGVGKSRFVQEVALRARKSFDTVWLLSASDWHHADDPWRTIASAAGIAESIPAEPTSRALMKNVRGRLLLIVDDADGASAVLGRWVAAVFEERPEVTILLAARGRPAGVPGELVRLSPLEAAPVRELLLTRARSILGRPIDWPAEMVEALIGRIEGNPAIAELLAARAALGPKRLLSADDLADDATVRSALDAVIRLTWEALSPRHQNALTAAALFPGDFGLDAFEACAKALDPTAGPDDLVELVDASLVSLGGAERYRTPITLRAFVRGKAGAERVAAWEQAFLAQLTLAGRATIRPRTQQARAWSKSERVNLLWGAKRAVALRLGETAAVLALAAGLEGRESPQAYRAELVAIAELEMSRETRLMVLLQVGRLDRGLGHLPTWLEEAATFAESPSERARVQYERAEAAHLAADSTAALAELAGIELSSLDAFTRARIALLSGSVAETRGRVADARRSYRVALEEMRSAGYDIGTATVLSRLSALALLDGNIDEARELALRAEGEAPDHPSSVLIGAHQAVLVEILRGAFDEARRHFARVQPWVAVAPQPRDRLSWSLTEARVLFEDGQVEVARARLPDLRADAMTLEEPFFGDDASLLLGEIELVRGHADEAARVLETISPEHEVGTAAMALAALAEARATTGQEGPAREALAQAHALIETTTHVFAALSVETRSALFSDDAGAVLDDVRRRAVSLGILPTAGSWRTIERVERLVSERLRSG